MSDAKDLLRQLMAIPSINPRGAAEAAETPIAEWIAQWAQEQGLEAETHEVVDGRRNVLVTLRGASPETLLLETHLDTVETENMDTPFEATEVDGKIFGRGSCDAKGPLAVFLSAMVAAKNSGPPPFTVVLAGVVDEEHQYKGVQAYRKLGLEPFGAVIGEPTSLRMVTAHKGCMRCVITASGPGGHSSEPWGKTNPLETMAEVVLFLRSEAAKLDQMARPLVGPPSLAVTLMSGGTGPNILPETASITVDRRTVAGEDPMEVFDSLKASLLAEWPNGLSVAEPHIVDYALETDTSSPFVSDFSAGLVEAGLDGTPKGVGHGTDASKIALDGVPCVVFGPGAIAQAHIPDEYVPVADLETAQQILESYIKNSHERGLA